MCAFLLPIVVATSVGLVPMTASPAEAAKQVPSNQPVLIQMSVPADAVVWFDGDRTSQSGTFRQYLSPVIPAGRNYSYQLKVQWTENGRQVEKTGKLTFHPGERVRLDFTGAAATETVSTESILPVTERGSITSPAVRTAPATVDYWWPADDDKPKLYDENDFPPVGGPPGGWDHFVGD